MIFTKIIDQLNVEEIEQHPNIEWIELDWDELNKRILRKMTNKGREIALSLEHGEALQPGAVLYKGEDSTIVVQSKPEEVFLISPRNIEEMGKTAFELGNRHTPCLIEKNQIIVRYDSTLGPLLDEVGVPYEKTEKRFSKAFKYKGDHSH